MHVKANKAVSFLFGVSCGLAGTPLMGQEGSLSDRSSDMEVRRAIESAERCATELAEGDVCKGMTEERCAELLFKCMGISDDRPAVAEPQAKGQPNSTAPMPPPHDPAIRLSEGTRTVLGQETGRKTALDSAFEDLLRDERPAFHEELDAILKSRSSSERSSAGWVDVLTNLVLSAVSKGEVPSYSLRNELIRAGFDPTDPEFQRVMNAVEGKPINQGEATAFEDPHRLPGLQIRDADPHDGAANVSPVRRREGEQPAEAEVVGTHTTQATQDSSTPTVGIRGAPQQQNVKPPTQVKVSGGGTGVTGAWYHSGRYAPNQMHQGEIDYLVEIDNQTNVRLNCQITVSARVGASLGGADRYSSTENATIPSGRKQVVAGIGRVLGDGRHQVECKSAGAPPATSTGGSPRNVGTWRHSSRYVANEMQMGALDFVVEVENNTSVKLDCETTVSATVAKSAVDPTGRYQSTVRKIVYPGRKSQAARIGPVLGGGQYRIVCTPVE